MSRLSMTRRSFVKAAVVAGAATAMSTTAGFTALAANEEAAAAGGEVKRVRTCCRGCGKMECGVWVTVQDGRCVKVEGDQSSFQSSGNCCGKSQSSIQAAYHPDRIYYPKKRTNPKGEEAGWQRITWDEAFELIGENLVATTDKYGDTSFFGMCGTSRQWVYAPYCFYKWLFRSPNAHVASEICKGPRRFVGWITCVDGSPWMAVRDNPRVYLQWGTAQENSNYDDSCRNVVDAFTKADVHINVDARLTGSSKEADYWLNIKPGTDGALAMAMEKLIIDEDLVDWKFIERWTNAPILVCADMEPTGGRYLDLSNSNLTASDGSGAAAALYGGKYKTRLLKECDVVSGGSCYRFYAWNKKANDGQGGLVYWDTETTQWQGCQHVAPARSEMTVVYEGTPNEGYVPELSYDELAAAGIEFDLTGTHTVTLADGSTHTVKPVWTYLIESLQDCTLDWCHEKTGLDPELVRKATLAYATRLTGQKWGNGGVGLNLSPDQEGNCFQTVRSVMHISYLTGNFDIPAGNRGLTRAPVDEQYTSVPGSNMPGLVRQQLNMLGSVPAVMANPGHASENGAFGAAMAAGNTAQAMDLLPDAYEQYKGALSNSEFPMISYYNEWSDATMIWEAATEGSPYYVKCGINESGSFMNMSNAQLAWKGLSQLDFWVDINMFHHPGTEMADVVLPCHHWTEINNVRVSQGASGGVGATVQCVEPPADTLFDHDISCRIFEAVYKVDQRMSALWTLPNDTTVLFPHDNLDRMNDAFKGDYAKGISPWASWDEYVADFQEHGWWEAKELEPDRWGTYRRYETGYMRMGKDAHTGKPWTTLDKNFGFPTPSALLELWPIVFENLGLDEANRLSPGKFDFWDEIMPRYEPAISHPDAGNVDLEEYPFVLTTGRRIPVYFHSEHRQLPWCRELWPAPRCELNPADAERLGVAQGDWVWIETAWGKVRQTVDVYAGIHEGWANCEHAWWYPELPGPTHGFELSNIEMIWNPKGQDKFISSHHMRGVPVKIYKATADNCPNGKVVPCAPEDGTEIIYQSSDARLKSWLPISTEERNA
jgi:sulfite dehydrogenase (quinone) subunit SoeA